MLMVLRLSPGKETKRAHDQGFMFTAVAKMPNESRVLVQETEGVGSLLCSLD
jgi:hypothetical protein